MQSFIKEGHAASAEHVLNISHIVTYTDKKLWNTDPVRKKCFSKPKSGYMQANWHALQR